MSGGAEGASNCGRRLSAQREQRAQDEQRRRAEVQVHRLSLNIPAARVGDELAAEAVLPQQLRKRLAAAVRADAAQVDFCYGTSNIGMGE